MDRPTTIAGKNVILSEAKNLRIRSLVYEIQRSFAGAQDDDHSGIEAHGNSERLNFRPVDRAPAI
jgi:hypothetical protein